MSHDLLVQMAYNTQLCHTGDDGTTIKHCYAHLINQKNIIDPSLVT